MFEDQVRRALERKLENALEAVSRAARAAEEARTNAAVIFAYLCGASESQIREAVYYGRATAPNNQSPFDSRKIDMRPLEER